jgi:hypothetical protein
MQEVQQKKETKVRRKLATPSQTHQLKCIQKKPRSSNWEHGGIMAFIKSKSI